MNKCPYHVQTRPKSYRARNIIISNYNIITCASFTTISFSHDYLLLCYVSGLFYFFFHEKTVLCQDYQ